MNLLHNTMDDMDIQAGDLSSALKQIYSESEFATLPIIASVNSKHSCRKQDDY
jgi:hypothetical protein